MAFKLTRMSNLQKSLKAREECPLLQENQFLDQRVEEERFLPLVPNQSPDKTMLVDTINRPQKKKDLDRDKIKQMKWMMLMKLNMPTTINMRTDKSLKDKNNTIQIKYKILHSSAIKISTKEFHVLVLNRTILTVRKQLKRSKIEIQRITLTTHLAGRKR